MAGLLACGPAAAGDWSFEIDPGGMNTLASEWQEYFGVHYATVDRFEPEWFARPVFLTVRGYGGPHVLPPQIEDPETGERVLDVETLAEHNPPKTGPFTGKDVFISLADIAGNSGVGLDALVPGILDNGLTAVYGSFVPASSVRAIDQDYVYWTTRLIFETFPEALDRVLIQWGNEISAPGKIFSPGIPNDPQGVPIYADQYLAPAVEALRLVERDLIVDGVLPADTSIPVVMGSIGSSTNENNRAWMRDVLEFEISDRFAPSLAGRKVWELVDYITIHYPFAGNAQSGAGVLDELFGDWVEVGKVEAVWITEEHGRRGQGPADLLNRAMHFVDWVAGHGADAGQTRMIFWSTSDAADPGGDGIEAVDSLGSALSGRTLHQDSFEVGGAEAFVLTALTGDVLDSVVLTIVPEGFRTPGPMGDGFMDPTPVTPGLIEFRLPAGGLNLEPEATVVQYSLETPSVTWMPEVSWDPSSRIVTVDLDDPQTGGPYTFDQPLMLTVSLSYARAATRTRQPGRRVAP